MLLPDFNALIQDRTPFAFVLGNPVQHSLSPRMHQTAALVHKLDFKYYKLQLFEHQLRSLPAILNQDHCLGCNITIPYKTALFDMVDHITENALQVGAINTIAKDEQNRWVGHNTDLYGFMQPLLAYQEDIEASNAIVFGSGGASRAVISALEQLGLESVTVVSRQPASIPDYKVTLALNKASYANWPAYCNAETTLLVNTTPLGMKGKIEESPIQVEFLERMADKICYDIVYTPRHTQFLQDAQEYGGIPIGGLDMLIYQGSKAFELWTELSFPIDEIRSLLMTELASNE